MKDSKIIPWSDEEIILLKLSYACKGAKTWREISQDMQEYTGIIRTTPSLISRIQKIRDDGDAMTIADMSKLYHSIVFDTERLYTKKFIEYVDKLFSKQFSSEQTIENTVNTEPSSQIEKNRVDYLDGFDYEIDGYEEDRYVDEDEYKNKWNLGLILDYLFFTTLGIVLVNALFTYFSH